MTEPMVPRTLATSPRAELPSCFPPPAPELSGWTISGEKTEAAYHLCPLTTSDQRSLTIGSCPCLFQDKPVLLTQPPDPKVMTYPSELWRANTNAALRPAGDRKKAWSFDAF